MWEQFPCQDPKQFHNKDSVIQDIWDRKIQREKQEIDKVGNEQAMNLRELSVTNVKLTFS